MAVRLKCSKEKSKMRKGSELILKSYIIAGWVMFLWLKALTVLREDLGSILSTHTGSHTYVTPHLKPSSGL